MSNYIFTGSELIADILSVFPEAAEILAENGIACANCHINQYETLKDGILGHGYSAEKFEIILSDLNLVAEELGIEKNKIRKKDPVLTDAAREKILEFQAESQKIGFGLKIEVTENGREYSYFMDFQEFPEKGDRVIRLNGIKFFCDESSFHRLQNKKIDFVILEEDEGFKFEEVE